MPDSGSALPANGSIRLPAHARVVAIGDVHGDVVALRKALKLARAIDENDRWIGEGLTVVQTGDQIDRGDQDRAVLDLLERLESSATAGKGALYVLNGNHEVMNVALDFRYVTPRSFAEFQEFVGKEPRGAKLSDLPEQARGRAAAFAPGGAYATKLARHRTLAIIGDSLFVHAGVLPAHVAYGLGRINDEVSDYLDGKRPTLPEVVQSEDAPIWTRVYGGPEVDAATCRALGGVLDSVGARRMVVGHTVQKDGISAACGDRLFRIDVGLSAYYGNTAPQVLEITAAGVRIVRGESRAKGGAKADSALQSAP